MQPTDFAVFHEAALEADEIRHSLLLSIIRHFRNDPQSTGIRTWTLGGPGECAMQTLGYPIVLGNLSEAQSRGFAETLQGDDYPGVFGSGETAPHFARRARELGAEFSEEIPQLVQAVGAAPQVPSVPGFPRQLQPKDFELFRTWTLAFIREAVPSDPVPSGDALKEAFNSRRHWLWILEDRPVSIAAITRRTRNAAFINGVYTPPEYRNRGFAAAITAIVAREIFSDGRKAACLYTDLRNPASRRCYAKLGFRPVCSSWHIIRRPPAA
jgi:hypothetical protein